MDRLDALELFVRVVDAGSFSAAARQTGIGQPAVSKAVTKLEEWLGVGLLLRSTRTVVPTDAGRVFYERARRTVEEADEAARAARGSAAGLTGRLRVSASVCFARLHVIPRLPAFLSAHPRLDLELLLEDRVIDPVEEGVDLALRTGDLPDSTMTARKLAECRRVLVASPDYLAEHGTPIHPRDLDTHEAVILARRGGGTSLVFRRGDEDVEATLRGHLTINESEGLRAAVTAGIGLAVASEWSFAPELRAGTVQTVMTDWTLPTFNLSAVFPSGRLASPKARTFASFVEDCAAMAGL